MRNYELLYIVSNQFTDEEAKTVSQKVNAMIAKYGGTIGYEDNMGKKKLAYPINHALHGYYFCTEFESDEPTKIKDLTNDLKLDKEVLRAQIIIKPKITAEEIEQKKNRVDQILDELDTQSQVSPIRERREERKEEKTEPAAEEQKPSAKPVKTKNLDEKLDELLKDDTVI
jgi:small subunit ribosomal protein S6